VEPEVESTGLAFHAVIVAEGLAPFVSPTTAWRRHVPPLGRCTAYCTSSLATLVVVPGSCVFWIRLRGRWAHLCHTPPRSLHGSSFVSPRALHAPRPIRLCGIFRMVSWSPQPKPRDAAPLCLVTRPVACSWGSGRAHLISYQSSTHQVVGNIDNLSNAVEQLPCLQTANWRPRQARKADHRLQRLPKFQCRSQRLKAESQKS